jgi:S-adenosylmethionine:tRNA ribosyltransferase-isomerase
VTEHNKTEKFNMPDLGVSRFRYELDERFIAQFPLEERDASRLLVCREGHISHRKFTDLPNELPPDSMLVFNDTRVIPARLVFTTAAARTVEVFLLNPIPGAAGNVWECMVGNRRRWGESERLEMVVTAAAGCKLAAIWYNRERNLVQFTVEDGGNFLDLLESAGKVPLPPYIRREAEGVDKERYQTVFAVNRGAVAAPTAALHFTPRILARLDESGIGKTFITLHVGAGTFKPVTVNSTAEHRMHQEVFHITRRAIDEMRDAGRLVAVGTTALRVMESLPYIWQHVKAHGHGNIIIHQEAPYREHLPEFSRQEVLRGLSEYMREHGLDSLSGETCIFIVPGYRFSICEGLVTNFHQPGSTLLMLVEAFIGEIWKEIYREAMAEGYRFLSYGDSSLLIRNLSS